GRVAGADGPRRRRAAPLGQDPPHFPRRGDCRMSASIRFLGFAVLAWAGVRAASLGLLPGTASLTPTAEAATRPVAAEALIVRGVSEPMASPVQQAGAYPPYGAYGPYGPFPPSGANPGYPPYPAGLAYARPVAIPVYYPVPAGMARAAAPRSAPSGWGAIAPTPQPLYE